MEPTPQGCDSIFSPVQSQCSQLLVVLPHKLDYKLLFVLHLNSCSALPLHRILSLMLHFV
jgi:hypothetical protein